MPGKKGTQSVLDSMTGSKKKKQPAADPLSGFKAKKKLMSPATQQLGPNGTGGSASSAEINRMNDSRNSIASTAVVTTVRRKKKKGALSPSDFSANATSPEITIGSPGLAGLQGGGFDASPSTSHISETHHSRPSTSESFKNAKRPQRRQSIPSVDSFRSRPDGPGVGEDGASPERRNSVGSTYTARKKKVRPAVLPQCNSQQIVETLQEEEVMTLESLFDPLTHFTSPLVLAYVFKDNFSLLSSLTVGLLKAKSLKRNITEATAQHLTLSYEIVLPDRYHHGDVPVHVVCESVQSLPMNRLEHFVADSFNLAGLKLSNSVISKPVFASYLLRYNLTTVWDEIMTTRTIVKQEVASRHAIYVEEEGRQEPNEHYSFYWNVIKPNLAAAKVQRCWKCRAARKEIQRRVFMRKHRVGAEADDDEGEQDDAFIQTWRTTKGVTQGGAAAGERSQRDLLVWLSTDSLVQLCVDSTFLLCSMLLRMLDTPSPLGILENRHVLWVTRAYGVQPPANATLHTVCRLIKSRKESVMSVIDDALRLADVDKMYNGIDTGSLMRLLQFFDCITSLVQEFRHLNIPHEPVSHGVFYLLARVHKEAEGREFIEKERTVELEVFAQRSREHVITRQRAVKAKIKIQNAQSVHGSRPLTDFKTDKELILYGAPDDFEKVVLCQSIARSHLARKHFKHTLAMFTAAKSIQKFWKSHVVRQKFNRALAIYYQRRARAVLLMQTHMRMFLAMRQLRRDKGSIVFIQSIGRASIARSKLGKYITSCKMLQRAGRCSAAKDMLRDKYLSYRAVRIQNLWRQIKAKRAIEEARYRMRSVLCIQRMGQGGLGRSRLRLQVHAQLLQRIGRGLVARAAARNEKERPQRAAHVIQKQWRLAKARGQVKESRELSRQNNAATSIQLLYRNKKARDRVAERREELHREHAAVKIQCLFRKKLACNRLRDVKILRWKSLCAVVIQRYARVLAAKHTVAQRRKVLMAKKYFESLTEDERKVYADAACCIQRAYRCHSSRRRVALVRCHLCAARIMQRMCRATYARLCLAAAAQQRDRAVDVLQRVGRGKHGRLLTFRWRPAAVLQTCGRGLFGRRDLLYSTIAGTLQRFARGYLGRQVVRQITAVGLLKRVYRGYVTRLYFRDTHGGALLTCGVGDAVSVDFMSCGGSVSTSQLATLVQQAEVGRRTLRRSCAKLQSSGRAFTDRREFGFRYNEALSAVQRVQRVARAAMARWTLNAQIRRSAAYVVISFFTKSVLASKLEQATRLYKSLHNNRTGKWVVQRVGRGAIDREKLQAFRHAMMCVQRMGRACTTREHTGTHYHRLQGAARRLQCTGRGVAERYSLRLYHAAALIQRCWRCYDARCEAAARRHLRTVSQRLTRVFRGYQSRYVLLTRSERSIKVVQRVGRGLRFRADLRREKRTRDQRKAYDILHATDRRVRHVFFVQWRMWMETTVQRRLKTMANENLAKRLLILTDTRMRDRVLATWKRFSAYSRAAKHLQRVGRAAPPREITWLNLVAVNGATQLLRRVALGCRARTTVSRVHTASISLVVAATFVSLVARRVQVAAAASKKLFTLTYFATRKRAFEVLSAHRLWAIDQRQKKEMLQSLFDRTQTMSYAEYYRKLKGFLQMQKNIRKRIADNNEKCLYLLEKKSKPAHMRLRYNLLKQWPFKQLMIRLHVTRLLSVVGCAATTVATEHVVDRAGTALAVIGAAAAAICTEEAVLQRWEEEEEEARHQAILRKRKSMYRRRDVLMASSAVAHLGFRYAVLESFRVARLMERHEARAAASHDVPPHPNLGRRRSTLTWLPPLSKDAPATIRVTQSIRMEKGKMNSFRSDSDNRSDNPGLISPMSVTLVDSPMQSVQTQPLAPLKKPNTRSIPERIAALELREAKQRIGLRLQETAEWQTVFEDFCDGKRWAERIISSDLQRLLSSKRTLQAWDTDSQQGGGTPSASILVSLEQAEHRDRLGIIRQQIDELKELLPTSLAGSPLVPLVCHPPELSATHPHRPSKKLLAPIPVCAATI